MRTALLAEGLQVEVAIVNMTGYLPSISKLNEKGTFPVFQDSVEAGVWLLHGGTKDDMVVYDASGKLRIFFDYGGPIESNLSTPEGYQNVMDGWKAAFDP